MPASYPISIFLESAWTASIVPLSSEPTFFALNGFGQNMALPFLLVVAGATLGQCFDWWLGTLLLRLQRKDKMNIDAEKYDRARGVFYRYLLFLLVFCWLPFLNMLTLAAGFFGARLRLVLPLILLGEAAHYGYYLI